MKTRVILMLLALGATAASAAGQSSILGVLEDVPGSYVGERNVRSVRIVFQKRGSDWMAFRSDCPDQRCLKTISSEFPPAVVWNVGFDGRTLGQVTGRTPREWKFYSHIGLQEITSGPNVPTIGNRSAQFHSYTGRSVYRPLIANSEPYFSDPELWKPFQFSIELVALFRRRFRREFSKLCRANKQDETKLEPFPYRDQDIKLVKGYASTKGWGLARLHLAGAIECNDVEAGFEIDDPWFAIDPQHTVQYLNSGMWLVDAGDYDNDGKSELVFAIDGENRGGYELFYDNFKKHSVFEFGYH